MPAPSATQILDQAEYVIWMRPLPSEDDSELVVPDISLETWQQWLDHMMDATELWVEKTTKSGKVKQINMRERLFELELLGDNAFLNTPWRSRPWQEMISGTTLETLNHSSMNGVVAIRYMGSCRNDGSLLRPSHMITLLERISSSSLQLLHIHRCQLFLNQSK